MRTAKGQDGLSTLKRFFPAATPAHPTPNRGEITKAVKEIKADKAARPDGIPPEAFKADIATRTKMLLPLIQKVWEGFGKNKFLMNGRKGAW